MNIIWRPKLLSATGAQFESDATVQDGVHLRWMIDPRMGLPFEKKQRQWGYFQIYEQVSKFPCLELTTLDLVKANTPIPVHTKAGNVLDYPLESRNGFIYFLRTNQLDANLAAEQLLNQARSLLPWRLSPGQRDFISYIKAVSKEVKGETVRLQPFLQRGECCAIDIIFETGTGTVPGGDGSQNAGCLGILTAFAEKKYAWVRAYDKQGNLLVEDWIGRFAFKAEHINNAAARNKFAVHFRAAGIHHIAIVPIPGQPVMNRSQMHWIFCEEYCNAGVWRQAVQPPIRFNGNLEHYTPTVLQQQYYKGFKKVLDWNQAVDILDNQVLTTPEMNAFLQVPDTYREYMHAVTMNDNDPGTGITEGSMPLLPVLLHASSDPAVASLLGLYAYLNDQQPVRDIRIVGYMPFFEEGNLAILYEQFKEITVLNGVPYLVQPHLGFFDVVRKISVQLGALVLGPAKGIKPSPSAPGAFTTTVNAIDLPGDAGTSLFVDSVLKIPVPPFSLFPWLNVQAFEVDRKIGEGDFTNAAEDEESSPLQELGILPPVYFPSRQPGSATMTVRDDFILGLPPEDTVQYRARSFDVFARPGGWTTGDETAIPVPCHPPPSPSNLSASVFRNGDHLWVELHAGISGKQADLQALAQALEISIHTLDINANGAVDTIQWMGNLSARGLLLGYPAGEHYPAISPTTLSCLDLHWNSGKVEWDIAGAGSCDSVYPALNPVVSIIDDPAIDEVLLEFRMYKIQVAIASLATLAEGEHRWCSRMRIKAVCAEGDTVYSTESCTGFRYNMVLPPPPVVQPSSSVIPQSTFPDKKGNSYYTLLLNPLLAPVAAGNTALVNLYMIDLAHIEPDLSTMVDGNILLAGAEARMLQLARADRSPFKKMNPEPASVKNTPSYYAAAVEGGLENYFVLGVVGVNNMGQESSWDRAAILIFKTPKPLPKPQLRFSGIRSHASETKVTADISFRADFAVAIPEPTDIPVLQLLRLDLNGGKSRFAGQVNGKWNEQGHYYQFDFRDEALLSWRRYAYEGILVSKAGDNWVKTDQRAVGESTAPGLKGKVPLDKTFPAEVTTVAGGNRVRFAFSAGDFDFVLIKTLADNTMVRNSGKIRKQTITGLAGASLAMDTGGLNFLLEWMDAAGGEAEYTLRLSRGQLMPWTNKKKLT